LVHFRLKLTENKDVCRPRLRENEPRLIENSSKTSAPAHIQMRIAERYLGGSGTVCYGVFLRLKSAAGSGAPSSAAPGSGGKTTAEPPLERPMSADEARGFGLDGNGGVEGQPYTPTSEDQAT
jgi:hypothetical protein